MRFSFFIASGSSLGNALTHIHPSGYLSCLQENTLSWHTRFFCSLLFFLIIILTNFLPCPMPIQSIASDLSIPHIPCPHLHLQHRLPWWCLLLYPSRFFLFLVLIMLWDHGLCCFALSELCPLMLLNYDEWASEVSVYIYVRLALVPYYPYSSMREPLPHSYII